MHAQFVKHTAGLSGPQGVDLGWLQRPGLLLGPATQLHQVRMRGCFRRKAPGDLAIIVVSGHNISCFGHLVLPYSSSGLCFCASSASLRLVTSLAVPNHSTISPWAFSIGTACERIHPKLPSARRIRCSSSKTLLVAIAWLMAATT